MEESQKNFTFSDKPFKRFQKWTWAMEENLPKGIEFTESNPGLVSRRSWENYVSLKCHKLVLFVM